MSLPRREDGTQGKWFGRPKGCRMRCLLSVPAARPRLSARRVEGVAVTEKERDDLLLRPPLPKLPLPTFG